MTGDDHLTGLGKVIGNFHALEHALRIFLCEANGEKIEYPAPGVLKLKETHLTDRQSLEPIMDEYNAALSQGPEQQYRVDKAVVKIRDAIAHGRVASSSEAFPVTLYKFGKKDAGGQVPVEYGEKLTKDWFSQKAALLRKQIDAVLGCSKSRSYKLLKS